MPRPTSNLRVFVEFKDDTVFAGENVECTITFKNVDPGSSSPNGAAASGSDHGSSRPIDPLEHLRAARGANQTSSTRKSPSEQQASIAALQRKPSHNRNTSSLSIVESAASQQHHAFTGGGYNIPNSDRLGGHERRVSIVSLGGPAATHRPKHGRSASVQTPSTWKSTRQNSETPSALSNSGRQASQSPPPLQQGYSESSVPSVSGRTHGRSATVQISESWLSEVRGQKPALIIQTNDRENSNTQQSFQIPFSTQGLPNSDVASSPAAISPALPPSRSRALKSSPSHQNQEQPQGSTMTRKSPVNLSTIKSVEGTPRSSMDIYSQSNLSNETLNSEYPAQPSSRLLSTSLFSLSSSTASRSPPARLTEILMMGYARLNGSFTLDGSLVNATPFQEIKKKAAVGGQAGGGVVGVSQPAGNGGLLRSFNWTSIGGSIGESIGGFMGGSNPSSMKQMKDITESNDVPLLSTSKSVLFVDLKLAPGQSRSFSYKFELPRGLPPTHRGRAMKVGYNLVIGVQRPSAGRTQVQQIKQVEFPFRVFSGVNAQGESFGHDLMSPYIILEDRARTACLDDLTPIAKAKTVPAHARDRASSAAAEFESYVSRLLTQPRRDSLSGLISPTAEISEPPQTPTQSFHDPEDAQAKLQASELVDLALRECSNPNSPQHIPTSFKIARSSIPIASLSLSRSAVKLGDLITCVIDFSDAKLPCYAFEATLESSEKIDPSLAIRSAQSVERATRRIWARTAENTLWARRCTFRAQVPVAATPAFTTTGVELDWYIKLELVIGFVSDNTFQKENEVEEEEEVQEVQGWAAPEKGEQLLEVVSADRRGTVFGAAQRLPCHSFDVTIPLRVFGAVASSGEGIPLDDAQGLSV